MLTQTDIGMLVEQSALSSQEKAKCLKILPKVYSAVRGSTFLDEELAEDILFLMPYFSYGQQEELLELLQSGNVSMKSRFKEFFEGKSDLLRKGERLLRELSEESAAQDESEAMGEILDAIDNAS